MAEMNDNSSDVPIMSLTDKIIEDLDLTSIVDLLGPKKEEVIRLAYDCGLRPLTDDLEFQLISNYFEKTQHQNKLSIEKVWSVRQDRKEKMFEFKGHDIKTCAFLWHGTKVANIKSILTKGLIVGPSRAIFMAEAVAKSFNYCDPMADLRVMFLCKAALGTIHQTSNTWSTAPIKYDSRVTIGDNGLDWNDSMLWDNAWLPFGELGSHNRSQSVFRLTEYVVSDPDQVLLRYMIVFRLNSTK